MADNATAVFTGVKEFDTISSNQGVVIGDVSGCPKVIGSSSVHMEINLVLKLIQALRQTTLFNIRASRYSHDAV